MRTFVAFGTVALAIALIVVAVAPGPLGEAARDLAAQRSASQRLPLAGGSTSSGLSALPPTRGAARRARAGASPQPRRPLGAQVVRPTALRASPGGPEVDRLERRTTFQGPQILAVVAQRNGWFGVLHDALPNGRTGWVRARDVKLWGMPYTVTVDVSDRVAVVRKDGRMIERFRVGIGRAPSVTPTGRFAISDRLKGGPGSPYGCCIFALSGRQPVLPAGWPGGDRLALHGTPNEAEVGRAVTAGCMNARASVLRRLMRVLPVGTRVTVRA